VNRFDAATTKQTLKLKRTKDVLRNRTTPSATDIPDNQKRKRGRPQTGVTPLVGVRLPNATIERLDQWAKSRAVPPGMWLEFGGAISGNMNVSL